MFRNNLDNEEREMVFNLAAELTGTCQTGNFRHEILVTNVLRRMNSVGTETLEDYLVYVENTPKEMPKLVSALTIHTTNWFREMPHYTNFKKELEAYDKSKGVYRLLCAACSTGEEPWSFALVLEKFRQENPGFDYLIYGRDIDPVSVKKAQNCVYGEEAFKDINAEYMPYIWKGSGKTKGLFTLSKEIRSRSQFEVRSLKDPVKKEDPKFNKVVCRNVLIYFSPEEVKNIVKRLLSMLVPNSGILTVGHSEALDYREFGVSTLGHSSYSNSVIEPKSKTREFSSNKAIPTMNGGKAPSQVFVKKEKYKVLVVDDSATVRGMMSKMISAGGEFQAFPVAGAKEADEFLAKNEVDIITLDIHMPEKDGPDWLMEKRAKGMKTPVIIVSDANPAEAQNVLNALGNGAQDYIEKKDLQSQSKSIKEVLKAIIESESDKLKMQELSNDKHETDPNKVDPSRPDMILVGASTGGTEALVRLLKSMPANCPPVVVVQHISEDFAGAFAARLASQANLKLAEHKIQELKSGYLYMSTLDEHIGIVKKGAEVKTKYSDQEKVSSHRPSVDFLFESAVEIKNINILSVLLTGMGKDGARGLLKLKNAGHFTICQDAESSIVWGMPGEATKMGAPLFVGDTTNIRKVINASLSNTSSKKKVA